MKKAVIFDVDGTLLDTSAGILNSVNYALDAHSLPRQTWESCVHFVGHGLEYLAKGVAPEGTDEETAKSLVETYRDHYNKHFNDDTVPFKGVPELISRLKDEGYILGVLSNKPMNIAKDIVDEQFGKETFAAVLGREEGLPFKPHKEAIYWICDKLHTSVDEAVFIGDSTVDLDTANAAGIDGIMVSWGFTDWKKEQRSDANIAATCEDIYKAIRK